MSRRNGFRMAINFTPNSTFAMTGDLLTLVYKRSLYTVPKKWRTVLVNWGLKEAILNGFKGPESDFGGSKIRKDS